LSEQQESKSFKTTMLVLVLSASISGCAMAVFHGFLDLGLLPNQNPSSLVKESKLGDRKCDDQVLGSYTARPAEREQESLSFLGCLMLPTSMVLSVHPSF
jgi:hypothetical protein